MPKRAGALRFGLVIGFVAATAGPARLQQPDPLDPVRQLLLDARFAEAEARARTALATAEAASGSNTLPVARVLDGLVEALWRGGKIRTPETKALAERSVAIKESQLGSEHPEVAYSLATLGVVLRLRGDYAGATSMFERALTIQERSLGPVHPDLARTLSMTAALALETGDLRGGESLHARALAIRQQALPAGDPAIAESLNGLGVVHERKGDGSGAEHYHEQALAIRERALGPAHPEVATSLNNLANVKGDMGDYAAARSLHERALSIREKALDANHPDVAMSLNNLAVAIRDLGDLAAAWWPLERVLGIYEQTFGPAHPNVAIATQNLASLLVDLRREAGTRLLAERARRLRSGNDARFLSTSLNGLVGLEPPLDSYRAARALLEHALALKERALGPEHTSVAATLTTLASVHVKLAQPQVARPLFERALAIREKVLGPVHPSLADTLDPLGELLVGLGDYDAARPIYERELAILEGTRGADHPRAGMVRQRLAELLLAHGDTEGALQMALDAERIGRDHLRLIGRALPEREALSYAATRAAGTPVALTLLARGDLGPSTANAVWDTVIRSRAMVLDEMASRHRTLGGAEGPEVGRLAQALTSKREQLARLVVRGPDGPGDAYRMQLERARDERDAAERALAERSLAFRQEQLQRQLGFTDVKAALPPGSALIAFVRYLQRPVGNRDGGVTPGAAYVAFVTRSGDSEAAVISLGAAADIDRDIAQWRRQMAAVAFAGGRSTARAEAAIRQTGTQLRAKVWDPMAPYLEGASRIFIVPDGPLHLVNWETLPVGPNRYLIEQAPPVHYLSAERDLVPVQRAASGNGLVVVDSPVFDRQAIPEAQQTATSFRGPRSGCGTFRSMRFDPLPASAREAATILRIWRQGPPDRRELRLSGQAATEAALKEHASGARILHLATHAFFLGSRCASPAAPGGQPARDSAEDQEASGNPFLLAGFALTGANQREAAGPDADDGILTAEEVAALDLQGTEWAVLSACDTGVGEVLAGEGVFGLRRAFQVAGVRTVIMSLWPVDDEDTRRWMTSVYERRVVGEMTTMEAVRDSTLEQLRRRRQAGASTHPFYWGGFIAAGDWR